MSSSNEHERQCAGDLADLRYHWGDAYVITRVNGMFRAERRDDGAAVACATAAELREQVWADYSARPVPRQGRREIPSGYA